MGKLDDIQILDSRYRGLALPIYKRPGGYFATEKTREVIKSDLRMLFSTAPGERVMLPTYGVKLRNLIFEPNDTVLESLLRRQISDAIRTWEPRVALNQLKIRQKNELVQLDIGYTILSLSINDTLSLLLNRG